MSSSDKDEKVVLVRSKRGGLATLYYKLCLECDRHGNIATESNVDDLAMYMYVV